MSDEQARREVLDRAAALAEALLDPHGRWAWESLRDAILAGLQTGGLHGGSDPDALRRVASALATIVCDARRSTSDSS